MLVLSYLHAKIQTSSKLLPFYQMFNFRPATLEDLELIIGLAQTIWRDWYPAIIGQAQVDYMLAKGYSAESIRQQMETEKHHFLLAFRDGQALGYASVSCTDAEAGAYFLHKFYTLPSLHNQGLGGQFLEYLLQIFNPKTLRLTVNRKNYIPINFYFKHGFKIEQVADFDIGNGYFMNDFVMLKTVKNKVV
jgi:diamine N-acetyltransferase